MDSPQLRLREVQARLSRAAARLDNGDLGAAMEHVQAALALDAGFAPALALQARIRRELAEAPARPPVPPAAVPEHARAAEWQSFEHRMRQRRADRCARTAWQALEEGHADEALAAVDELQRMRPDHLELPLLLDELGALLMPVDADAGPAGPEVSSPPPPRRRRGAARATGVALGLGTAAALALMMLTGLDRVTPPPAPPPPHEAEALEAEPRLAFADPAAGPPAPEPAGTAGAGAPDAETPESPPEVREPAPRPQAQPPPAGRSVPPPSTEPAARPPRATPAPAAARPDSAPDRDRPAVPTREPQTPVTARRDPGPPAHTPAPEPAPAPSGSAAILEEASPPAPAVIEEAAPALLTAGVRLEEAAIRQTLGQYEHAYNQLDAVAARAVWPSVDQRALTRAFQSLESQEVVLQQCSVAVDGDIARASCQGRASYVPRIGNRSPLTETRQWTFLLRHADNRWRIEGVEAR